MKTIRLLLVTISMMAFSLAIYAQDYNEYLQNARQRIAEGDCDAAQRNYNVYKSLTYITDKDLEHEIEECRIENSQKGRGPFGVDYDMVTSEIKTKVANFQRYVNNLAGNSFSHDEKEERYQLALELFIGKGNPYEIIVPTRYGERKEYHEAVKMGVFPSKNSKERKYYYMKDYLSSLISKSENPNYKYKKIVIECSRAIRIDNFRKIGDGRYVGSAHYLQKYTAYKSIDSNTPAYWDYTGKTITIYINRIEIDLPDGSTEHYWEILLGDVDCDDVW